MTAWAVWRDLRRSSHLEAGHPVGDELGVVFEARSINHAYCLVVAHGFVTLVPIRHLHGPGTAPLGGGPDQTTAGRDARVLSSARWTGSASRSANRQHRTAVSPPSSGYLSTSHILCAGACGSARHRVLNLSPHAPWERVVLEGTSGLLWGGFAGGQYPEGRPSSLVAPRANWNRQLVVEHHLAEERSPRRAGGDPAARSILDAARGGSCSTRP